MIWRVMGHVLQLTAVHAAAASARHLILTKRLAVLATDFAVMHLSSLAGRVSLYAFAAMSLYAFAAMSLYAFAAMSLYVFAAMHLSSLAGQLKA